MYPKVSLVLSAFLFSGCLYPRVVYYEPIPPPPYVVARPAVSQPVSPRYQTRLAIENRITDATLDVFVNEECRAANLRPGEAVTLSFTDSVAGAGPLRVRVVAILSATGKMIARGYREFSVSLTENLDLRWQVDAQDLF